MTHFKGKTFGNKILKKTKLTSVQSVGGKGKIQLEDIKKILTGSCCRTYDGPDINTFQPSMFQHQPAPI